VGGEVNLTGLIWVSCNNHLLLWVVDDVPLTSWGLRGAPGA